MAQQHNAVFNATIVKSCYPTGCATPGFVQCQGHTLGILGKPKIKPTHSNIEVTSKPPVGGISVVTLIRTDTTLDHSQKAEKVCLAQGVGKQAREACPHDDRPTNAVGQVGCPFAARDACWGFGQGVPAGGWAGLGICWG